jgi:hypothetical protein
VQTLMHWIDGAFETDFERWTPPVAMADEETVDTQAGQVRVADSHDGWMPPHMIESDIQSIFG